MTMIKGIGSTATIITPVVPYAHSDTASPLMPITPATAISDQFDKDPSRNWRQFLGEAEQINYTIILENLGSINHSWKEVAQNLLSVNEDMKISTVATKNEATYKTEKLEQLLQIISLDTNHLCLQL